MYLLLLVYLFLPIFNFTCSWFLGIILRNARSAGLFVSHVYLVSVFIGVFVFWKVCSLSHIYYITFGTWVNCGLFVVNWGFIFDVLSVSMLLMVSIVSGSVHFYSIGYMKEDPCLPKFMSYLSLFTFFMFILVTGDNFVQLFLGWEGIGLCSYLLISFWNTRIQANKGALKALIINRIGDFGFICGFLVLIYHFKSADFSVIFAITPLFSTTTIFLFDMEMYCLDLICIFLFIGSMGKSSQMGLHTWLPDAMEGPTPVSALIHSATLVTAGIFLIIRCSPIFEFAPTALFFVMLFGGMSSFFAATIALTQNDIKKVIAYSTASQLGYMVFICGLSAYNISMFHLVNHAFFKALLFLSAGSLIHALSGDQDMRKFSSLCKVLPYTYSMVLIGSFALAGLPFLSGFYSKDLILDIAFSKYAVGALFVYWFGTLTASLTAFYTIRLLLYIFYHSHRVTTTKYYIQNMHELPEVMGFSLAVLASGSIFSGFCIKDAFVGLGTIFWGNSIYISGTYTINGDVEFMPSIIKNIPLLFSFFGIFSAVFLYENIFIFAGIGIHLELFIWSIIFNPYDSKIENLSFSLLCKAMQRRNNVPIQVYHIARFFNKKWYFDYMYNYYIACSLLKYAYSSFYKLIDKGFLDIYGPYGITVVMYQIAKVFTQKQSGYLYHSNCLLIIGLVSLIMVVIVL